MASNFLSFRLSVLISFLVGVAALGQTFLVQEDPFSWWLWGLSAESYSRKIESVACILRQVREFHGLKVAYLSGSASQPLSGQGSPDFGRSFHTQLAQPDLVGFTQHFDRTAERLDFENTMTCHLIFLGLTHATMLWLIILSFAPSHTAYACQT